MAAERVTLRVCAPGAPVFVGSEIYRHSTYGARHPLAVPRVSTVIDLCRALGWLPDAQYVEAPIASEAQAERFHSRDYLEALRRAEVTGALRPAEQERFGLGVRGNPIYPEMYRRPMTSLGGVLRAVALAAAGAHVFCPGGGTHHGRPDRASGFCYVNDPVLGILAWLDGGVWPVAYVDIDAHHGDGVQDAFADDPRVLFISLHEAGRWPRTGAGSAGNAWNFPLAPGSGDDEALRLLEDRVLPMVRAHRPAAVMVQAGADALAEDPLSGLCWSNGVHRAFLRAMMGLDGRPALVVTGGGGYNPWSVARCWTGLWATMIGAQIPARLPPEAEAVLRRLSWDRAAGRSPPDHWFTTLADGESG